MSPNSFQSGSFGVLFARFAVLLQLMRIKAHVFVMVNVALSPFAVILGADESCIAMQGKLTPVTFLSKDIGRKKSFSV